MHNVLNTILKQLKKKNIRPHIEMHHVNVSIFEGIYPRQNLNTRANDYVMMIVMLKETETSLRLHCSQN